MQVLSYSSSVAKHRRFAQMVTLFYRGGRERDLRACPRMASDPVKFRPFRGLRVGPAVPRYGGSACLGRREKYGKMATYLKQTSKLFDLSLSRTFAEVNLRDLMCPVCRGILIEPVTLPCTHNLCLRCLKGTFEHNSLTCPLCRVRVGSWLRTATKSQSLVNNGLWELIRAKFPKEVEDKHNGDDGDIELDAGFTTASKILSAPGEIRREYEAQLQMAEEEICRQRQVEQMASEALIRKIQVEEQQQHLAQLAQDRLLAKTLAKKQVVEKQKDTPKSYDKSLNVSRQSYSLDKSKQSPKSPPVRAVEQIKISDQTLEGGNMNLSQLTNNSELRPSNIALISKIRAERYASSMKANPPTVFKESSAMKFCCQKPVPAYNAITRTVKHKVVTKFTQPSTSNYSLEAGCSTSKIYGTQSKEELHVPSDVLNSKKKSLGVEVCMTLADNDERIGSAESAGSHDSINQEIHHFKPIKAMPRTPLKVSADGKQIDLKLIRVVPILKRVSNAVPKLPSPTNLNRMIGCSWSAFRGKARQDNKAKESPPNPESDEFDKRPLAYVSQTDIPSKPTKFQPPQDSVVRKFDQCPEMAFDSSKNCAKNINRIINGTKVSKKLILDEPVDSKIPKSWPTRLRNGMASKCKNQKDPTFDRDIPEDEMDEDIDEEDYGRELTSSASKNSPQCDQAKSSDDEAVENIAERIKRRKDAIESRRNNQEKSGEARRNGRKRLAAEKTRQSYDSPSPTEKAKRRRVCRTEPSFESSEKSDSSVDTSCKPIASGLRKSTRNTKPRKASRQLKKMETRKYEAAGEESCVSQPNENNNGETQTLAVGKDQYDEDVIKEQERIERLVLQERQDFELALRLQAKFDDMERIAGRTRGSRRAIETNGINDLYKIEIERTVNKHTARQLSTVDESATSTVPKQRGRPRKRVK